MAVEEKEEMAMEVFETLHSSAMFLFSEGGKLQPCSVFKEEVKTVV